MIGGDIKNIADQLSDMMESQKKAAHDALKQMPDSETKVKLKSLLAAASSGDLNQDDAQRELEKIIKNAS